MNASDDLLVVETTWTAISNSSGGGLENVHNFVWSDVLHLSSYRSSLCGLSGRISSLYL